MASLVAKQEFVQAFFAVNAYVREQELEADKLGIVLASKAVFAPDGATKLALITQGAD